MSQTVRFPWVGQYLGKCCAICGGTSADYFRAINSDGKHGVNVNFCESHLARGREVEAIFRASDDWWVKFPLDQAMNNEVPTEETEEGTDQPKSLFVTFLEVLAFICFCALFALILFF